MDNVIPLVLCLGIGCAGGGAYLVAAWRTRRQLEKAIEELRHAATQDFLANLKALEPACASSLPARTLLDALRIAAGTGFLDMQTLGAQIERCAHREALKLQDPHLKRIVALLEAVHVSQRLLAQLSIEGDDLKRVLAVRDVLAKAQLPCPGAAERQTKTELATANDKVEDDYKA